MFYLTTPSVEATTGRAAFHAAGASALLAEAIEAACAKEITLAQSGDVVAQKKLTEALDAYLGQVDEYVATPLTEALLAIRRVAPVIYTFYPSEKLAGKAVGRVYRKLFSGEGTLALKSAEAQQFFAFVRDVLVATAEGTLTADRALACADAFTPAHVAFLRAAVSEITTHDAKSAHSSAGFKGYFPTAQQPSRFFSAQAFPAYLSGRTGGGVLRESSWLEFLLPFSVSVAGASPVRIIDILTVEGVRAALEQQGVHAFSGLPILEPVPAEFDPKLLARVRVKVSETESVALNLMPANSLLKASVALAEKVEHTANMRLATRLRELALEGLDSHPDVAQFDIEAFLPCVQLKTRTAASKTMLKALNVCRKDLGLAALKDFPLVPADEFHSVRSKLVRSAVVGSNPNNCGGAFLAFGGTAGPYRFPAANYQARPTAATLRRFYGALSAELADKVKWLKERIEKEGNPLDRYKIGAKFLPVRRQKKVIEDHVDAAARAYVTVLSKLREKYALLEADKLTFAPDEGTPVQRYVLDGAAASVAVHEALAKQGLCVINVNDAYAAERFVEKVMAGLKGEGA